jgi:hypothetical protein
MPDITHHQMYNTVDRDDFASLVDVDRYAERAEAFDSIISATHDHFWDPNDAAYIDFGAHSMNLAEELIMPRDFTIELNSAVADRLDEGQSTPRTRSGRRLGTLLGSAAMSQPVGALRCRPAVPWSHF